MPRPSPATTERSELSFNLKYFRREFFKHGASGNAVWHRVYWQFCAMQMIAAADVPLKSRRALVKWVERWK